jgi:hypothetical protein
VSARYAHRCRAVLGAGLVILLGVIGLCTYAFAAKDPYALLAAFMPGYVALLMVGISAAELRDLRASSPE